MCRFFDITVVVLDQGFSIRRQPQDTPCGKAPSLSLESCLLVSLGPVLPRYFAALSDIKTRIIRIILAEISIDNDVKTVQDLLDLSVGQNMVLYDFIVADETITNNQPSFSRARHND